MNRAVKLVKINNVALNRPQLKKAAKRPSKYPVVPKIEDVDSQKVALHDSVSDAFKHLKISLLYNRKLDFKKLKLKEPTLKTREHVDMDDLDIDTVYNEINQEPSTKQHEISSDYLKSLKMRLQQSENLIENKTMRPVVTQNLESEMSEAQFSLLQECTELVHLNALAKRPNEAQLAFEKLLEYQIEPNIHIINALLLAYFNSELYDQVWTIFQRIFQEFNLVPTVTSYELLVKSLAKKGDYISIKQTIDNMQKNKIPLNLPIYQALIEGAVNASKVGRAFEIFNQLLTEIAVPNKEIYHCMIRACALRQDAEKALDLFQDMPEKGISYDSDTFSHLIEALGTRPDFIESAFQLVQQMKSEGYRVTQNVMESLLKCCVTQGDILRATILFNSLEQTVQVKKTMLLVYSNAIDAIRLGKLPNSLDGVENLPIVEAPKTSQEIRDQADLIYQSESSNSDLADAYLRVHTAEINPELVPNAIKIFNELYQNAPKTGKSFKYIYRMISKKKESMEKYGQEMFDRYIQWDAQMEHPNTEQSDVVHALKPHDVSQVAQEEVEKILDREFEMFYSPVFRNESRLSFMEKEQIRASQCRSKEDVHHMFCLHIRGLARIGMLQEAINTLKQASEFRDFQYLPRFFFKDVRILLVQAMDKAEHEGNHDYINQLLELLPKPDYSPLDQVKQLLRQKSIHPKWWGWEAVGIGMKKRQALLNEQNQEFLLAKRKRNKV